MKLNNTPRVIADQSVHFAFKDVARSVNMILDQLNDGNALPEYADDAAAETGGLSLYSFYRTGSIVKQRVA